MSSTLQIAYIAEGKLYLKSEGSDAKLVSSPFVQSMIDRAERDRQRNDWKDSGGMAWNFRSAGFGAARTGMVRADIGPIRRVQWKSVTSGPSAEEIIYGISAEHVGGIFLHHIREDHERRLLHRNAFVPADLSRNPFDGSLALSSANPDGSASIAVMKADGKGLRELTEGDSVDQSPTWGTTANKLYFQSAGIGRAEHGGYQQLGPYAIVEMNTDTGELTTVAEDSNSDYLTPRVSGDGTLYYIRRPYEPFKRQSVLRSLQDVLLFPFRLMGAIVHFLNVFSIIFSNKPLLTSGGPEREGPDIQRMFLWGRLIDAKKIAKSKGDAKGGLVPSSWELRSRQLGSKDDTLIAKGVAAFDLSGSNLVYTDASTIWLRSGNGDSREVARGQLIERVLIVTRESESQPSES